MVIFYLTIMCLYIIFLIVVIGFWKRDEVLYDTTVKVSVVVVVRDEEKHIQALLKCFENQKYPVRNREFLIVDDNSTDRTLELLEASSLVGLKVLKLNERYDSPKKKGIELAMSEAEGELVLFTDGDCVVGEEWLVSLVSYAKESESDFLCAPVLYHRGNKVLDKVQFVEMFSLIGVTGSSIRAGFPSMSNAANMLVRKSSFEKVGGYGEQSSVVSGDDELLMHKLYKQGFKVRYYANDKVVVRTSANATAKQLVNQRRRWGSKWNNYELPYVKVLALFIFTVNVISILGIVGGVVGFIPWHFFLESLAVKAVLEYFMMNNVAKSLDEKSISKIDFLLTFLLYPFYVVFIGVMSNIKGFEWKGRQY